MKKLLLIGLLLILTSSLISESITWSLITNTSVTTQGINSTGNNEAIGGGMGTVSYGGYQSFPAQTWPSTIDTTSNKYIKFPIFNNVGYTLVITQLSITGCSEWKWNFKFKCLFIWWS